VRVVYAPAADKALKEEWKGDVLISNSVVRTYYTGP
jgi:hypothetical protein